jgi:hypothetical protein
MISLNKLVSLVATVGFCRAVFVGAICLLMVHAVTFEEFVIVALFGFAIDGGYVREVKPKTRASGLRRVKSVRGGLS